jgi:hypothetical protein
MIPDDCSQCRVCGVPVFGSGGICIDCDPVRDDKGRFVTRETAGRYRALRRRSLYGESTEDRNAAFRQLMDFFKPQEMSGHD